MPEGLIVDTLLELRERFGAVSCETQAIRGTWTFEAEVFRDDLVRVFVDADDVPASREFFLEFKERLKTRFDQLEIWMATYPIEVL